MTSADRSAAEQRRQVLVVLGLWLASRLVLLFLAMNPGLYSGSILGDVIGYGAKVERMLQGELPYGEVAVEYPPGSLPFTLLPALLVGTGPGYRLAFALTMLAVDAVGLRAAFALGRSLDPGRGYGSRSRSLRVPAAYVLGTFLAGPLLFVRFDIVPGVCVLLAALFAVRRRPGLAAAALGYGTAAKLFPVVLAPLLVLGLVPAIGWLRSFARTVPAFLAGLALTAAPALAISVSGTYTSVIGYHTKRGVQIESMWANGIELLHVIARVPARELYQYGAFDLDSPLSDEAKLLSGAGTVALVAFAALVTWRRAGGHPFGRRGAGRAGEGGLDGAGPAGGVGRGGTGGLGAGAGGPGVGGARSAGAGGAGGPGAEAAVAGAGVAGVGGVAGAGTGPGASGGLHAADWPLVFALGVLAFMLPTRVLSPQYLFWLVVLCAAAVARAAPAGPGASRPRRLFGRGARPALVLWCLSGPVTQLIFPFRYNALRHLAPFEVGLLTLRNGMLVAAAVVLARVLWPAPPEIAGTALPGRRAAGARSGSGGPGGTGGPGGSGGPGGGSDPDPDLDPDPAPGPGRGRRRRRRPAERAPAGAHGSPAGTGAGAGGPPGGPEPAA